LFNDIQRRFERRAKTHSLSYQLRPGTSAEGCLEAERRLGLVLPEPVRRFYTLFDGLAVDVPCSLDVAPLGSLVRDPTTGRLPFATLYGRHVLAFDTAQLNAAGEWTILFARTGYSLTQTLGSFLHNKLWGFLESEGTEWLERVLQIQERGPIEAGSVWIFMSTVPSGVFASREEAESWIDANGLQGTLLQLPCGWGAWEYAIRNNRFCPKSSKETTPAFIAGYCGSLDHAHFPAEPTSDE